MRFHDFVYVKPLTFMNFIAASYVKLLALRKKHFCSWMYVRLEPSWHILSLIHMFGVWLCGVSFFCFSYNFIVLKKYVPSCPGQDIGFSVEYISSTGQTTVSSLTNGICRLAVFLLFPVFLLSEERCFWQMILPYRRCESDQVNISQFPRL